MLSRETLFSPTYIFSEEASASVSPHFEKGKNSTFFPFLFYFIFFLWKVSDLLYFRGYATVIAWLS